MAQELLLRAPSERLLTLGLADEPRVSTTATEARFVGDKFGRSVQIGPPGYQELANETIMPARVVDRFVVDGREVRVAVGEENVNATVALIDRWHEVMTVFSGPPPRREDIIDIYRQFEYRDSPEGMAIHARPGTGLALASETIAIAVEGRGSLSVPGVANVRNLAPTHRGAPTAHGEVWKSEGQLPDREGTGANTYVYIVGTTTAVAEVIFEYRPTVDDPTLLSWLDEINLRWE